MTWPDNAFGWAALALSAVAFVVIPALGVWYMVRSLTGHGETSAPASRRHLHAVEGTDPPLTEEDAG